MSKLLEHTSDGTTANPSKLVCEKCKQTYTYQTLGSFGCLGYPTDTNQASEDEKLAKLFHDTYERLAPAFSYKTRKASAVPWTDVPSNNKGLMIAVAHEINDLIRTEKLKLLAEVRERVIGEDVSIVGTTDANLENQDTLLYVQAKIAQNVTRSEQREELTKLEAEL